MFQCVLKFGFLFFFLFSLPTFADNLAVSHTPESCVKYLVQNRLVEELKYIDMSWIPEKADYKNLILSLSIPESLIDKSFLSSWLQSGELWNFVAVDEHGILYNGHVWIKMSWTYVLNEGGLYRCSVWKQSEAKTDDILFYLKLNNDPNLRNITDRGNLSSPVHSFGGSPRPIPFGNGGVYWPR